MSLTLNFVAFAALLMMIFYLSDRLLITTIAIGYRLGIPPFLASVLFLGFGTSSPEYAVSVFAAIREDALLAIGNVFGSNITNLALVLGCAALLGTICINKHMLTRMFPVLLVATVMPGVFMIDLYFSRLEALVLLLLCII